MPTRDRVLHVLRGHEASRIRFTFPAGGGTVTVNRATFQLVANAVVHDRIHITVATTFGAGVGALYHPDTNTIETPPVLGRDRKSVV